MTKKQAIAIITKCAKQYQQYLEGNQVVFVYRDENNKSNHTAVRFHSHNFLHFTGVTPRTGMNANGFPGGFGTMERISSLNTLLGI